MNSADREHFLSDLRAAVMAGVPIDAGLSSGSSKEGLLTLKSLDQIAEKASLGGTVNSKDVDAELLFPPRLAVAAEVFLATRDMPLVLSGLSASTQAAREAVRSLRWTVTYLVIVLLVAWLGMLFFAIVLVPEIQAMRSDLVLSRRPEVAASHTSLPWIGYLAYLFGAILFCTLLALCVFGTRKFVMLVGGRHFVRCRVAAVANAISSELVGSGIDPAQAIALADRLSGATTKRTTDTASTLSDPNETGDAWSATSFHLRNSDRYLERMRASVPSIMVFLVGGCIALIYSTAVFGPIVELIRDLVFSGV